MSLIINPHYYDFFTRSLLPTIHYWPINEQSKCESIKFAVEWGNKHMNKVTFLSMYTNILPFFANILLIRHCRYSENRYFDYQLTMGKRVRYRKHN